MIIDAEVHFESILCRMFIKDQVAVKIPTHYSEKKGLSWNF